MSNSLPMGGYRYAPARSASAPAWRRIVNLVFTPNSGSRGYIVIITVLTLMYLMLELSFNARLVDVTGSLATKTEVTSIERWGRVISGMAVTLFVWGTVLMPKAWGEGWRARRTAFALALWAIALIAGTYWAEERLVDSLVDRTDAQARHAAVELRLLVDSVLGSRARVSGIDLSPAILASPEGKSLLALLPLQALSTPGLMSRLDPAMNGIVGAGIREAIGSLDDAYRGHFKESAREVEDDYSRYKAADAAGQPVASDPEAMWHQYVTEMEDRYGSSLDDLPPFVRLNAWHELNRRGIMVPSHWDARDHKGFIEAARAYFDGHAIPATPSIPPGLDERAFFALPAVQAPWRERLLGSPGDPTGILLGRN